VVAIRESDGSPLWTWTPPAGTPWGPPLLTDNLLFVSTQAIVPAPPNGTVVRYFTHALDLATGEQVWSHAAGGFLALGADGMLFITSPYNVSGGTLTAIAVK